MDNPAQVNSQEKGLHLCLVQCSFPYTTVSSLLLLHTSVEFLAHNSQLMHNITNMYQIGK